MAHGPISRSKIKTIAKSNTIKFGDCHGVLENMVLLIDPTVVFKGLSRTEYRELQCYFHQGSSSFKFEHL